MKLQFLNLKQRYNLKDYKFTLILLVLAVSVIGVFMVGSANAEYLQESVQIRRWLRQPESKWTVR